MTRADRPYWVHSAPEDDGDPKPRRPTGAACPMPCNSKWRRAQEQLNAYDKAVEAWEATPVGDPPEMPDVPVVNPWLGDPVLCRRCQSQTHMQLAELADLAAQADMENSGHRKGPDAERVSGSKHAASPSPVCDDLDELASMLRGWQSVALSEDETPPRTGYLMSEIGTLCSRLYSIHFHKLVANEVFAADFASEVRQWYRHLKDDVTRSGTGRQQLKRPCPRCDRYSLTIEDGADYVTCSTPTCGRLMSRDEFSQYDRLFDEMKKAG